MPKSLAEYAEWLAGRRMIWPAPPPPQAVKATPFLKPLSGIRAVVWSVYGTLLRISDGELLHLHPQQLRMQVALEKTIHEFNMWNSMTRKPGAPWESMLHTYQTLYDELRLGGSKRMGEAPEVNSAALWRRILDRLGKKEYQYDEKELGDLDALSEKVAWFFHASLQGTEATAHALDALRAVREAGLRQGLLGDAQPFTVVQLLRGLGSGGRLPALGDLFTPGLMTLSYQEGVRQPSRSLCRTAAGRLESEGIGPREVLYVASRLREDLAPAREVGFRTALFAGDALSLRAAKADLQDPAIRPDRLLTELRQLRELLSV